MRRIMLATDFSERSDRALRRAVLIARAHGAELDLIHVVDDDRPRRIVDHETRDARRLLSALARSLGSVDRLVCQTHVVLSDPFAGIVKTAAETRPDLLILGPHRRQILKDAFVGTTAERTIRSVSCPVLMVNGPPVAPWRHALLTTDLSERSSIALARFVDLGLAVDARGTVLHIFDAPALQLAMSGSLSREDRVSHVEDHRAQALRDLAHFMSDHPTLNAERVVRHHETKTSFEILKAAEELNADLIVVSAHAKGPLARFFLGSVTQQVLEAATVDVLVMVSAQD
jgi:nucleotide-binding universal stress UspA family protein